MVCISNGLFKGRFLTQLLPLTCHRVNQCWLIINYIIMNKLHWGMSQNIHNSFDNVSSKWPYDNVSITSGSDDSPIGMEKLWAISCRWTPIIYKERFFVRLHYNDPYTCQNNGPLYLSCYWQPTQGMILSIARAMHAAILRLLSSSRCGRSPITPHHAGHCNYSRALGPVSLRLMTSQFKDVVNHMQK